MATTLVIGASPDRSRDDRIDVPESGGNRSRGGAVVNYAVDNRVSVVAPVGSSVR